MKDTSLSPQSAPVRILSLLRSSAIATGFLWGALEALVLSVAFGLISPHPLGGSGPQALANRDFDSLLVQIVSVATVALALVLNYIQRDPYRSIRALLISLPTWIVPVNLIALSWFYPSALSDLNIYYSQARDSAQAELLYLAGVQFLVVIIQVFSIAIGALVFRGRVKRREAPKPRFAPQPPA